MLFFGQARLHIGTAIVMLRGRSRRGFRRAAGLLLRLRLRPRRGALAVAGEGWHVGAKAVHAGCWARRERASGRCRWVSRKGGEVVERERDGGRACAGRRALGCEEPGCRQGERAEHGDGNEGSWGGGGGGANNERQLEHHNGRQWARRSNNSNERGSWDSRKASVGKAKASERSGGRRRRRTSVFLRAQRDRRSVAEGLALPAAIGPVRDRARLASKAAQK